jgi:hypothetical protein
LLSRSARLLLPQDIVAPEHVHAWIASRLPAGARLVAISLFCTADLPERILCHIRFDDARPGEIAQALRGQTFGFDSAVVSLPIGVRYACRCRRPGSQLKTRSCSCQPLGSPVPSWFDTD